MAEQAGDVFFLLTLSPSALPSDSSKTLHTKWSLKRNILFFPHSIISLLLLLSFAK